MSAFPPPPSYEDVTSGRYDVRHDSDGPDGESIPLNPISSQPNASQLPPYTPPQSTGQAYGPNLPSQQAIPMYPQYPMQQYPHGQPLDYQLPTSHSQTMEQTFVHTGQCGQPTVYTYATVNITTSHPAYSTTPHAYGTQGMEQQHPRGKICSLCICFTILFLVISINAWLFGR